MARKFEIKNSSGGAYIVTCDNKPAAKRMAKEAERLLGWKIVSVTEKK